MAKRNVELFLFTAIVLLFLPLGSCTTIRVNRILKNMEEGTYDSIPVGEVLNEHIGSIYIRCSDEDNELFDSIKAGNLEALKKMIELHGTEFYCSSRGGQRLAATLLFSENYELIEYYLSRKPDLETRDEFFQFFLKEDSVFVSNPKELELFQLVVRCGARNPQSAYDITVDQIKTAMKYGYDLSVLDEQGNNELALLAIHYSGVVKGYYKINREKVDFYQSQGLAIKHKNKEGKTAIDLAENKRLKRYLKRKARKEE